MQSRHQTFALASLLALAPAALAAPEAGDTGEEIATYESSDAAQDQGFGGSVAVDGDLLLVAASGHDFNDFNAGAAYVFDTTTGEQVTRYFASDADLNDFLGVAALAGTLAVMGVPADDDRGTDSGSVYFFDALTGQELGKVQASNTAAGDRFGTDLAIAGDRLLVGAQTNDADANQAGAVYAFDLNSLTEIGQLQVSDPEADDRLGPCDAEGALAVLGASQLSSSGPGKAYVFDLTTLQELHVLRASDGGVADCFGASVAIQGTTVAVGATGDDDGGTESGAVYLFDATTGLELAKLKASSPQGGDRFGGRVEFDGLYLYVTATGAGNALYVFDATTQRQITVLAADSFPGARLGGDVAIDGSRFFVGDASASTSAGTNAGRVTEFSLTLEVASATPRNGAGVNASRLSAVTPPVLGATFEADVDCSGIAAGLAALFVYDQPSSGTFLFSGELLVDVTSPQLGALLLPHAGGTVSFELAVPADSSFCGRTAAAQAAVTGAPALELTNALDLAAGL